MRLINLSGGLFRGEFDMVVASIIIPWANSLVYYAGSNLIWLAPNMAYRFSKGGWK